MVEVKSFLRKNTIETTEAGASVITTRKGALPVMPTRDEIQKNMKCEEVE